MWRLVKLGVLVWVEVGGLGGRRPPECQGFALKRRVADDAWELRTDEGLFVRGYTNRA